MKRISYSRPGGPCVLSVAMPWPDDPTDPLRRHWSALRLQDGWPAPEPMPWDWAEAPAGERGEIYVPTAGGGVFVVAYTVTPGDSNE